jgi:GxxExxY protein
MDTDLSGRSRERGPASPLATPGRPASYAALRTKPDGRGLILGAETEAVIDCAFEVLKELGHGLLEKPYENALVIELGLRGILCEQQRRYDVLYKNVKVGEYVPDFIAFGAVVVDAKVIERITDHEIGQMLN